MSEELEFEPVSDAVKNECYERIIVSRTHLMMAQPFFGVLSAKLIPVENNTWCRTMAVDGKHLYYNVEFVMGIQDPARRDAYAAKLRAAIEDITDKQVEEALNGLTDMNLIAVMCHEILHCAYNHFLRRGYRSPKLWNKAADYAINQILVRDGIGKISDNWLFDARFDGMTAEEIYNILEEKENEEEEKKKNKGGEGESGEGGDSGDPISGGGTIDQHDPQMGPDGEMCPEEMAEYMSDFKNSMMAAAGRAGGKIPREIARMVKLAQAPQIDWRSKVQRTLRSFIKSDSCYQIPSRRSWSVGSALSGGSYDDFSFVGTPLFPGLKPDNDIDICVAIDASGSMSEQMLGDMLTEVIGLTKQFKQFKIRVLTFDTNVYNAKEYRTGEEHKLAEYPLVGGGGTDFVAVWDYMKEENYKPKQLIMFTDGMPWQSWGDKDYCPTLFVIHSNPECIAPFGETVHYVFKGKK